MWHAKCAASVRQPIFLTTRPARRPPPRAGDWKQYTKRDGRKWYYNTTTKKMTWIVPDEFKVRRAHARVLRACSIARGVPNSSATRFVPSANCAERHPPHTPVDRPLSPMPTRPATDSGARRAQSRTANRFLLHKRTKRSGQSSQSCPGHARGRRARRPVMY